MIFVCIIQHTNYDLIESQDAFNVLHYFQNLLSCKFPTRKMIH
jgi:hypothetical protein